MADVIPITGRHTSIHSMLATASTDENVKRGFVVLFDDKDVMYFGAVNPTIGDIGMAQLYIQSLGLRAMTSE